ncbi:MAG: DUF2798 domain-containing protein [Clostridia bacterium]|nr:DUF2798 domain-containing protein [Clostridia bacterium]
MLVSDQGKRFGRIITVIMAAIMGVIMAVAAIFVNHLPFAPGVLLKNIVISFLVALVIGLIVPHKQLGDRLAAKCGLKPESLGFKLVSNLVPSLIINTANTCIISGVNILPNPGIPQQLRMGIWGSSILGGWPIMFVVSYIASYFAQIIAVKCAMKICPPPKGGPAGRGAGAGKKPR